MKTFSSWIRTVCVASLLAFAASAFAASAFAAPTTMPTTVPSTQPTAGTTTRPNVAEAIDPSPEVLALVNDLGDDEYSKRDKAQTQLLEMTDAIEPQLRGALKLHLNSEANQRVLGILHKFDENRLLGPSVITMHYKDAPLSDVLEDFCRQCNADLGIHRPQIVDFIKNKKVSINLDKANFWESLRQISSVSALAPQLYNNESRMMLEANMGNQLDLANDKMVIRGPFAVIPQQCTLNRYVNYGHNNGGDGSNMSLQLMALAEPKLKIVTGGNSDWLRQCVDEKKHDLIANNGQQQFFSNGARQWYWQLQTPLHEVPDMGEKITSIKGNLKFSVQVKSEKVEIDDILHVQNVTRSVGGGSITVKQVMTPNNGVYQVHLLFTSANGAGWEQVQMMELLDKNGEAMQSNGTSSNGGNGQFDVTLTYTSEMQNFRRRGPNSGPTTGSGIPQKLVWEVPTETKEIEAPFEIKDLDLPHAPKK